MRKYPFDAVSELEYLLGAIRYSGSARCTDSAYNAPAISEARLRTYRSNTVNPTLGGMLEARLVAENVAPSATLVQALGLELSDAVKVGTCQDLYLTKPVLTFSTKADAQGRASLTLGRIPYAPSMSGFTFMSQAAYTDSKTGAFSLTLAAESEIVGPPQPYAHRRVSYTGTSPTATEGVFQNHREQPVFMYSTR